MSLNLGKRSLYHDSNGAGIVVPFKVVANDNSVYMVFQKIAVEMSDGRKYRYTEAWKIPKGLRNGKVKDYYYIPHNNRNEKGWYASTSVVWLEKRNTYPPGFIKGKSGDHKTPWGIAHGTMKSRAVPSGTNTIERDTKIAWGAKPYMVKQAARGRDVSSKYSKVQKQGKDLRIVKATVKRVMRKNTGK